MRCGKENCPCKENKCFHSGGITYEAYTLGKKKREETDKRRNKK